MRLQDALDCHTRERGDADFAVQDGRRLSSRQVRAVTERIAAALIAAGLEPGDRLAVLSKVVKRAPRERYWSGHARRVAGA
jgi:non-ribosomal peptide synthetase component E (peptide arylation enzyme)